MGDLKRQLFIESLPFHIGWIIVLLVGLYCLYTHFFLYKKSAIAEYHFWTILSILLVTFIGILSVIVNFYLIHITMSEIGFTLSLLYRAMLNSLIPFALSVIFSVIIILLSLYNIKMRSFT